MALRYLARRDYSEVELSRKLTQRGVAQDIAASISGRLVETGLVSDERFAEIFCRYRFERHYGPMRIRAELRSRGVEEAIISACMRPYDDQWHDSAHAWVARKASNALDRKEKARIYRAGMNRGFSHDQVMRALDRVRQKA